MDEVDSNDLTNKCNGRPRFPALPVQGKRWRLWVRRGSLQGEPPRDTQGLFMEIGRASLSF